MKGSYREINQKITSIKKVFRQPLNDTIYFGFIITLENNQTIKVMQEEQTLCCEQYDVVILTPFYEDDPSINELRELIGTYINGISWGKKTHEEYENQLTTKTNIYSHVDKKEYYCHIDMITDKGLIQFVCFNYHHGNYNHNVYVEWDDFTDLEHL